HTARDSRRPGRRRRPGAGGGPGTGRRHGGGTPAVDRRRLRSGLLRQGGSRGCLRGAPAGGVGLMEAWPKAGRPLRLETQVARAGTVRDPRTGAVAMPIYQTATFRHPGPDDTSGWSYTRLQNPTREALEETIAALEGGF